MGAFDGQLTYARFQVQGEPPKGFREAYLKAVQLRAFAPLQPEQPEQESVGWCVAGRVFELSFDYDALYYGDELALGLRVDRWRIPSAVLRAHLAEERLSQLSKRGVERLSRAQQEELKLRVLTRLRKRSLPSMKLMDLVWDLRTGTLRFWSHSTRMQELLRERFEQTFDFELVADSPWTLAEPALDARGLEALTQLSPLSLGRAVPVRES